MKALVLSNQGLEIQSMDPGALRPGHARIQTLLAGICGSDVQKINQPGLLKSPMILGHEFVGRVSQMADDIREKIAFQLNDLVAICPTLPCNNCANCKGGHDNLCTEFRAIGRSSSGGFAEYVDVPVENIYKIPESVSPRLAVLADVIAVGIQAIKEAAQGVEGKKCLVIGDGAIGLVLLKLLNIFGASQADIQAKNSENLKRAQSLNSQNRAVQLHEKYDVVFEAVGRAQNQSIQEAIHFAGPKGRVVAMGVFPPDFDLQFNNRSLFLKEASLTSSVAYKKQYFQEALGILEGHPKFEGLVTHEFKFEDFKKALEMIRTKEKPPVVKVILRLTD